GTNPRKEDLGCNRRIPEGQLSPARRTPIAALRKAVIDHQKVGCSAPPWRCDSCFIVGSASGAGPRNENIVGSP
ncbi:unnamed protein product, partial [Musa textilis]